MANKVETVDVLGDAAKDKFPEIVNHLDNTIELQRGLFNKESGLWERSAEVRELNGFDEERIASLETRSNITYNEYMTEILKMGVVSIGNLEPSFYSRMDELTIGDRNLLFLAIVRTTYGRERTFEQTCGSCDKVNKITIDLYDDFPIQEPSFDPIGTLKVKLKNGKKHELRPPTSEDTLYVAKNGKTPAQQSTLMIARCSVWEDGKAPEDAEEWVRSLGMADRGTLINALSDIKMGPKMEEVDVDCVHCGTKMPVMIDWIFLILN